MLFFGEVPSRGVGPPPTRTFLMRRWPRRLAWGEWHYTSQTASTSHRIPGWPPMRRGLPAHNNRGVKSANREGRAFPQRRAAILPARKRVAVQALPQGLGLWGVWKSRSAAAPSQGHGSTWSELDRAPQHAPSPLSLSKSCECGSEYRFCVGTLHSRPILRLIFRLVQTAPVPPNPKLCVNRAPTSLRIIPSIRPELSFGA